MQLVDSPFEQYQTDGYRQIEPRVERGELAVDETVDTGYIHAEKFPGCGCVSTQIQMYRVATFYRAEPARRY